MKDRQPTELIFLLDKSGSMSGLESDTIGGFDSLIREQREKGIRALVTVVLFNEKSRVLFDRLPLDRVPPLTREEYAPRGNTALFDAVGSTILRLEKKQTARPPHTLFVITTDGMENASREFSLSAVRRLIRKKRSEYWEFLFLGANFDAESFGQALGLGAHRSVTFRNDRRGQRLNFQTLSHAVESYCQSPQIADDWDGDIRRRNK